MKKLVCTMDLWLDRKGNEGNGNEIVFKCHGEQRVGGNVTAIKKFIGARFGDVTFRMSKKLKEAVELYPQLLG